MNVTKRELQSEETGIILNTIDNLRQLGLGSILELPQIIVCGDQSSGKSSVLNAVSTLQFPTKDVLCTRFATEVIMRPGRSENIFVTIVPGTSRSGAEKTGLESFRRNNVKMDDIESIISEATRSMGIDPDNPQARRFSDDILRFEVTGPEQPSLTLVDLPGIFQAENKYQTEADIKSVQELVLRYMKNKRSVILAVISAKSEFVLQSVTQFSGKVDPKGLRTLGVITKPDKLDEGSESERMFVELAENKQKFLHRGWHVLVNRDHSTRNFTQDERDDAEKEFLSKGVWTKIPGNHKGVFSLRSRLSVALRELIVEGLPDLMNETESEITQCEANLSRLGPSRARPEDRRKYLMQASQTFNSILRSCINGSYDDEFFNMDNASAFKQIRLRAVVQNTLMEYSQDMQQYGHSIHIIDDGEKALKEGQHPHQVTQTKFEEHVMDLMKDSRGRELLGTHNPMIVRELFQAQSEPWIELAEKYRAKLVKAAKSSIDLALLYATDGNTKAELDRLVIQPAFEKLLLSLKKMIDRLLNERLRSHPITYNANFSQIMARAKQVSAEKLFSQKYERAINKGGQVVAKDTLKWLFEEQIVIAPAELPHCAASEAINVMRAYYKIAKERLVDNFSTLAIEECLISQMPDIFCPETVVELDDDIISDISMETDEAASERARTDNRLELCRAALEKLKTVESMRGSVLQIPGLSSDPLTPRSEVINDEDLDEILEGQARESLSKLDIGLSEHENRALSTSGSVVESDHTLPTRFVKGKYLRDGSSRMVIPTIARSVRVQV